MISDQNEFLWEQGAGVYPHKNCAQRVRLCVLNSEELDKFMETQGASAPGILTLTTSLSKPFMRLDKYPTLLQELERHVEVLEKMNTSTYILK